MLKKRYKNINFSNLDATLGICALIINTYQAKRVQWIKAQITEVFGLVNSYIDVHRGSDTWTKVSYCGREFIDTYRHLRK